MIKTCDGCKHWDKHPPPVEFRGNCNSKKFVYDDLYPEDGLVYWFIGIMKRTLPGFILDQNLVVFIGIRND